MELFGFPLNPAYWDLAQTYAAFSVAGQAVGVLSVPSVLLRRAKRPMAQLAWILCLVTLPGLGVLLWWFMGRTHLDRKRRRRAEARQRVAEGLSKLSRRGELPDPDPDDEEPLGDRILFVDDNEIFPTTANNRAKILVTGVEAFPEFEKAIRAAKDHIHVQFYIWKKDDTGRRLRDALVDKAREGVEVRFLYDAFGAAGLRTGSFLKPLKEAGAQIQPFLPFRIERSMRVNFRNHRKILVCDGEVGFTGGLNVGDEYNEWYDMACRIEGPAVNQLQEVFAEDWYFATQENLAESKYFRGTQATSDLDDGEFRHVIARVMASGPDSWKKVSHVMFFLAITNAEERIWITNPYFVPDTAIMVALTTAAMRGVDVRLLLPGKSDVAVARRAGRGYYEELLQAGVKIYEYQPEILHAKTLVFDDNWSIVGSANMDNRSFNLQFEVNLVFGGEGINGRLADEFLERLEDADEITAEEWEERSTWQRLVESGARLFSPVL